jgi:ThiD2 family
MNSKILRIIDANVNRTVEGLRVMEDICRFILEKKTLTSQLKKMRSKIRLAAKKIDPIIGRKVKKDVGRKSYTKSEKKRKSVNDIFVANAKRAQEALRVLEEFAKLSDPKLGKEFKAARFKLYTLEQKGNQALIASAN